MTTTTAATMNVSLPVYFEDDAVEVWREDGSLHHRAYAHLGDRVPLHVTARYPSREAAHRAARKWAREWARSRRVRAEGGR
jgi:muconolactone delta-isomerase